jgi:hypothetical protein
MRNKPCLLVSLENINKKLFSYKVGQNAKCSTIFKNLKETDKEKYINKFEEFFYFFSTLVFIFKNFLFLVNELNNIKVKRDIEIKKRGRLDNFMFKNYNEISFLNSYLYNTIAILIKLLEDNELFTRNECENKYPEIHYVRQLRNSFIQHASLISSFNSPTSTSIPGNHFEIPFSKFEPGGGGWAFINTYYNNKITDKSFMDLSDQDKIIEAKKIFSNKLKGKWKNINQDVQDKYKILATGLPKIDQQNVANEIDSLFYEKLIPELERRIEQAKKDTILF